MAEKDIYGRIHSFESFGASDGPGVRFIIFFQGCPLRCIYCHNPDTWDKTDGKLVSAKEIAAEISGYMSFIKSGGVTLSGGEPLFQPDFALEIIKECKKLGLHTAIDTSGGIPLKISKPVIDECDMLLLDLKGATEQMCKTITGQSNKNMIETLEYCEKINKRVWIRHVLVPGFTLNEDELKKSAELLSKLSCIEKVELLPFHKLGEFKWDTLKIPFSLKDTETPDENDIKKAKEIFLSYGIKI